MPCALMKTTCRELKTGDNMELCMPDGSVDFFVYLCYIWCRPQGLVRPCDDGVDYDRSILFNYLN